VSALPDVFRPGNKGRPEGIAAPPPAAPAADDPNLRAVHAPGLAGPDLTHAEIANSRDSSAATAAGDQKTGKGVDFSFFHAFVATLSVIIVSELGDKTFFIAAIMAMRHARSTVFGGAMLALALMHVMSSFFGKNIKPTVSDLEGSFRVFVSYISVHVYHINLNLENLICVDLCK